MAVRVSADTSTHPGSPAHVVVAGGSRGLGRALVQRYANDGCTVVAGCRDPASAGAFTGLVQVERLDVSDPVSVCRFAAAVSGAGPIDLLINAAGIDARALGAPADKRGPFEIDIDAFVAEVRTNAGGPMLVTRELLSVLRRNAAKVINLSSRVATMSVGAEVCWDMGYNASKAALNAVTVRMAKLLHEQGMIVVAVHPGWVRTNMGGAEAHLPVDEAVGQIVALARDLTLEQTGMFLNADGSQRPW